jgi:hypothetical protein
MAILKRFPSSLRRLLLDHPSGPSALATAKGDLCFFQAGEVKPVMAPWRLNALQPSRLCPPLNCSSADSQDIGRLVWMKKGPFDPSHYLSSFEELLLSARLLSLLLAAHLVTPLLAFLATLDGHPVKYRVYFVLGEP